MATTTARRRSLQRMVERSRCAAGERGLNRFAWLGELGMFS